MTDCMIILHGNTITFVEHKTQKRTSFYGQNFITITDTLYTIYSETHQQYVYVHRELYNVEIH